MKLNELSIPAQEKLRKAGFNLEADINKVQGLGGAGSYYEYAPLHNAAHIGDIDLINELLDNNADIDCLDVLEGVLLSSSASTPLMVAASQGRVQAVWLLLNRGANLNKPIEVLDSMDFFNFSSRTFPQGQLALREAVTGRANTPLLWSFVQNCVFRRECDYDGTITHLRQAYRMSQ